MTSVYAGLQLDLRTAKTWRGGNDTTDRALLFLQRHPCVQAFAPFHFRFRITITPPKQNAALHRGTSLQPLSPPCCVVSQEAETERPLQQAPGKNPISRHLDRELSELHSASLSSTRAPESRPTISTRLCSVLFAGQRTELPLAFAY
ncbi:hypothetical protein G7046_g6778 [Stylonectria norvegica]|nr:hypothetical protein G7046_g6778 [Stylonectria norvegica]